MRDEEGSALIETCFLAILLLVPLIWALLAAASVQRTSYAAAAASRESVRAFVTTDGTDSAAARERANRAGRLVLDDFGGSLERASVAPVGTLAPGGFVTVTVRASVPLPFLPSFLRHAAVPVSSTAIGVVDDYR